MILITKPFMDMREINLKGLENINNIDMLKQNETRINKLVEMTKQEYPLLDNYFIWLCACDFVM